MAQSVRTYVRTYARTTRFAKFIIREPRRHESRSPPHRLDIFPVLLKPSIIRPRHPTRAGDFGNVNGKTTFRHVYDRILRATSSREYVLRMYFPRPIFLS